MDCFVRQEDGRLLFSSGFTDKTHLFSWILSFEDKAELLEPGELRQEMACTAFLGCIKYIKTHDLFFKT